MSGGVDSAVAAAIVQRAIGDRLHCVFVDHGLLREGEAEQVERDFVAATGVNLHVYDARETFLAALAGVTDPEEKRKEIQARLKTAESELEAAPEFPHTVVNDDVQRAAGELEDLIRGELSLH